MNVGSNDSVNRISKTANTVEEPVEIENELFDKLPYFSKLVRPNTSYNAWRFK